MVSLGFPKPRVRALEKQDRTRARISFDEKESKKVRQRARGQCEIRERVRIGIVVRCYRKPFQVHHMIGGIGQRGIGESAKAIRKQFICGHCHRLITAHILQRQRGGMPHYTDSYVRAR